jgi:hypothetical protein
VALLPFNWFLRGGLDAVGVHAATTSQLRIPSLTPSHPRSLALTRRLIGTSPGTPPRPSRGVASGHESLPPSQLHSLLSVARSLSGGERHKKRRALSSASTAASVWVVLVHGRFVDGSGWRGVYKILVGHSYGGVVMTEAVTIWP